MKKRKLKNLYNLWSSYRSNIEQCLGLPNGFISTIQHLQRKADLEQNMLSALEAVPLESIRK